MSTGAEGAPFEEPGRCIRRQLNSKCHGRTVQLSGGRGRILVGARSGSGSAAVTLRPVDLWRCNGSYVGFRDGDGLWSGSGKYLGKCFGGNVFTPAGLYLGELLVPDRLAHDS